MHPDTILFFSCSGLSNYAMLLIVPVVPEVQKRCRKWKERDCHILKAVTSKCVILERFESLKNVKKFLSIKITVKSLS